jgi:hypothetical protein
MFVTTSVWRVSAPRLARVLIGLLAVLCVSVLLPASASATVTTVTGWQQTWGTNGRVSAVLTDPVSGRVYVAGSFTAVTDASGANSLPIANLAAFDPASGTFDPSWHPNPNGAVTALALSGGQLYLGGTFTQVAGISRWHLAAVDTAGTGALSSWKPRAGGSVDGLSVSGGWVYVGGNFTSLAGVSRSFLGRVSVGAGVLDTSWAPTPSARVRSVVVSADGSQVYIGGDFLTVNGSSTGHSIASIDTSGSGTLTSGFHAGATNDGSQPPAYALYLDGSTLLAGVGGSGGACAALDAHNGITRWSQHGNGDVHAVTALNGTAYCGGHFSGTGSFGGQTRNKLAAVDETSGALLSFALRINSSLGVFALDHDATRVYMGGDFTKINGKLQPHFAVLS